MNPDQAQKEKNLCKQLYYENKGGCNWGRCKDCGVIPLVYKLETGKVLENEQDIRELKKSIFQDDKYL